MNITELSELRNTVADLQKKLDEASKKLEAAEAEAANMPPHSKWRPEDCQYYYFIDDCGMVCCDEWREKEDDFVRYEYGNVYKTAAAAAEESDRREVISEMREWAGRWDDPWVIMYQCCEITATKMSSYEIYTTKGEMRFAKKEDAENCINAVGELQIRKYYFGIPD